MATQAAKRISATTVSWQKLGERLTAQHSTELAKLKGQNSTYSAQVNQYEKDLPKIDFTALKKKLPAHTAVLDSLQKQYESLSVPYGEIPAELSKEIDKWKQYNEARIKLNALKAEDGEVEAKKVEEKWTRAPPIEQFYSPTQFLEYFGGLYSFYDLRIQNRLPDPFHFGANEKEFLDMLAERFSNYEIKPRPDEGH